MLSSDTKKNIVIAKAWAEAEIRAYLKLELEKITESLKGLDKEENLE
jgi:hypothetical protein